MGWYRTNISLLCRETIFCSGCSHAQVNKVQPCTHDQQINKKTLTAEAVKNGLPIPQITSFWV